MTIDDIGTFLAEFSTWPPPTRKAALAVMRAWVAAGPDRDIKEMDRVYNEAFAQAKAAAEAGPEAG